MDTEILEKYKIKFYNHTTFGKMATGSGVAEFLDDSKGNLANIDSALEIVEYHLNNGVYDADKEIISFNMYSATVVDGEVLITTDSKIQILQVVPLQDFKKILLSWKEFLI